MAVTRRGYIFSAFLSSVLCVLLIVVALSSDSWVVSLATTNVQVSDSELRYGLFRGELILRNLATPNINTLYMTCISNVNACALSCKTDADARIAEVEALAAGFRPSPACLSITDVDDTDPLEKPPVISYAFYVSVITILCAQLFVAVTAAGLAILNATKNPTEPIFGLPGCLWTNVATACLGCIVMLMFGIYWLTSGLNEHLALAYIALGTYEAGPGLGYSYWLLIVSILCAVGNIALIQIRAYLLERDPPPPMIKVENHSDGTIFLY
ncbi:uncharacterized protein LOC113494894 [Trichoplusia ni]|uniref:Uncharacterized protein LOC113494894 n=1 Tax=Trichoplusia ni TaxID=7111 RepID=A0A7E5VLQ7_TRINI|nr:uncharacterized protein LOC113494894 [Trichoplusia ni]